MTSIGETMRWPEWLSWLDPSRANAAWLLVVIALAVLIVVVINFITEWHWQRRAEEYAKHVRRDLDDLADTEAGQTYMQCLRDELGLKEER